MSLAKTLMESYKRDMKRLILVPSDKGRFEISVNGKLVYSKLETGRFPEESEAMAAIDKAKGAKK